MKKVDSTVRILRIVVGVLAVLVVGMAIFVGLRSRRPAAMTAAEAAPWIAAYAPERIGTRSAIRVELTDSLWQAMDTLRPLDRVFRFSPSLEGTARWGRGHLIEFVPARGALRAGREYTCRVRLDELAGDPELPDFAFTFRVAERQTELRVASVRVDPEDISLVVVEGELRFSEPVEAKSVRADRLYCDLEGAAARAEVVPTDDSTRYRFRLSGIERPEDDLRVRVSYLAEPLGFDNPEPQPITVPGLAEFKLLSAERHEAAVPYIELEFSSPLDAAQQLDGLVTIDRLSEVRFERNGTNIKLFYDPKGLAEVVLQVSELVRSADGRTLAGGDFEQRFEREVIPPAVEIPLSGTILPDGQNLRLPFRAVNLAAVDVEVVKIYADNMLNFLQDNDLDGTHRMRRTGRLIYRRTVRLDRDRSVDLHAWQNFAVDLSGLFRQERGAIYNIRLSFRHAYSLYDRTEPAEFVLQRGLTDRDRDTWDKTSDYIDREAPDYEERRAAFDWSDRNNPSKPSYYMVDSRMPDYNLAASSLGLIVKRADTDRLWTTVSNLLTTAPVGGVRVTAYNYQLREIGHETTDGNGFADFSVSGSPFVVTAADGRSVSYLKISEGNQKSLSRFDVGGETNPHGLKGFIYGERDVWRPGDTLHLTLLVEDRERSLPANHPVTMELRTPEGQLYDRQILTRGQDGFYVFEPRTDDQAPTGLWEATFRVGNRTFLHPVRIETIKPNRLKIRITAPEVIRAEQESDLAVESHWLTGPAAAGLETRVEMRLFNDPQPFEAHRRYTFSNPLLDFTTSEYELAEGTLDSTGCFAQPVPIPACKGAPGMLRANLICRVAEAGGDESITARSVRYSPYASYVGIDLGSGEFETDTTLTFPLLTVDDQGKPMGLQTLAYKVYRLTWSWWWEGSVEELNRYVRGSSAQEVASGELTSDAAGRAVASFRVAYPEWGRYLVFVRDQASRHATGGVVTVDWPDWRGRAGKTDPTAPTMLAFALDKKQYEAGETATVYLPASAGGRALLSIENGSRVISRRWVTTAADRETAHRIPVTQEMAPNFYLHATLLQPHARTVNGQPIRLYGVQGAEVVDRRSMLHPEIRVPEAIRPQETFTVRVREQQGRPMTYTLAVVDEGLLDITSFRTPDPWRAMNRRQALGVSTWDLYDRVVGAYAGRFPSILSIGGDAPLEQADGKEKRFNPVVKFLGPFTLERGTGTHRITLPMYVGSVRVMVVAARGGSYGAADKTVAVRSPLMVLPTLPRTLACGDRVSLPVNVFALEQGVGEVKVEVRTEGAVRVDGAAVQQLRFTEPTERMIRFGLKSDPRKSGPARVTVTATGGGHTARETLVVEVSNPQPEVVESQTVAVESRAGQTFRWAPFRDGQAKLELAAAPAIDFNGAFSFVENYPHCCSEQLSSRAFFLLYARRFLADAERRRAEELLPEVLKTLCGRQLSNGGFVYWPGDTEPHEWVTSMAGQVLVEARRQGFGVPLETIDRWTDYQQAAVRGYRHASAQAADLQQAYRIYTLVLAEREPTAAMNRLRESRSLSRQAVVCLASAYALAERPEAAGQLLDRLEKASEERGTYATFWSAMRDEAQRLEAWMLAGRSDKALGEAEKIARRFGSGDYYSTQEVAFAALAMNRLFVRPGRREVFFRQEGETPRTVRDLPGAASYDLRPDKGAVELSNRSEGILYATLTTSRRPATDERLKPTGKGLTLRVRYLTLAGDSLAVDRLRQGDEFLAEIEVRRPDATPSSSMALTFVAPAGWEIWNDRIFSASSSSVSNYRDVRDDRISWYFPLSGEKSSRWFRVRLRAAYAGRYLLPPVCCEDMYDGNYRAMTGNRTVEVVQ